jgi:beta-phosphoglucomutase-like phosphatase (HAD superfamily)
MSIFQGAIFDADGVLVDSPHETAWRESLRELMESDWSDIRGRTVWWRLHPAFTGGTCRASLA